MMNMLTIIWDGHLQLEPVHDAAREDSQLSLLTISNKDMYLCQYVIYTFLAIVYSCFTIAVIFKKKHMLKA